MEHSYVGFGWERGGVCQAGLEGDCKVKPAILHVMGKNLFDVQNPYTVVLTHFSSL